MVLSSSSKDNFYSVVKLHEYLTENLKTPFEWGKHDCVLFANNWIFLKTGKNILADYPKWASAKEALRFLQQEGGIKAAVDKRLKQIHPNLAKDGDIALYEESICIFSGSKIVGPSESGLIYLDRTKALCAWSHLSALSLPS
jgi:hypothetical protein